MYIVEGVSSVFGGGPKVKVKAAQAHPHPPSPPLPAPRWPGQSTSTEMVMTFQSSSPSSIMARHPMGLTLYTPPISSCVDPTSTTSTGSLSPITSSSGCATAGSSHVCGSRP